MGIFGTDGIRGCVGKDFNFELVYSVGLALGNLLEKGKILIGRDTRCDGNVFATIFASGARESGCCVVDVGVCPTAGVAYLTKTCGFDFGVVISASHNPSEFNGIKIFDSNGQKLTAKKEQEIEDLILKKTKQSCRLGTFKSNSKLTKIYKHFLKQSISNSLKNKTIVLDCANGATSKFAKEIFEFHGANVISTHVKPNGKNINKNCGSLNVKKLQKNVLKNHADMGFSFDGDGDRVIAVDEKGDVINGDKILYMLAVDLKNNNQLNPAVVVGTIQTNKGAEIALNKHGIKLIRTDVGDKNVCGEILKNNLILGAEQSGHVIINNKFWTGDGLLVALHIAEICSTTNKKLSNFFDFALYEQCNINVQTLHKQEIANSQELTLFKTQEESYLNNNGRILIRPSGTEPCVRVMVETKNLKDSKSIAQRIKNKIIDLDKEFSRCAE